MGRIRTACLLILLCLTGCVRPVTRMAFEAVQSEVESRTSYSPEWLEISVSPDAVAATTKKLLEVELTQENAVRIALLNNRRLQAVYTDLGIAAGELIDSILPPNPRLSATAQWHDPGDGETYVLGALIDLIEFLLIPANKGLAEAQLQQAKLIVAGQILDVIAETRRAYINYVAEAASNELWRTALLAGEASYETAVRLRQAGNIPEITLLRERDFYERIKLALTQSDLRLVRRREILNQWMGLWGGATNWSTPTQLPEIAPELPQIANLESDTIERNLDLAATWFNMQFQGRRLGIQSFTRWLPELSIGVEAEREPETEYMLRQMGDEYRLDRDRHQVWKIGPSVEGEIPLFDWGQGEREQLRMRLRRSWDLYTARAVEIRAAARSMGQELVFAQQRALYQRDVLVPLRHTITQQTQWRFNAMFDGVFRLLQAKQDEIEAGRRLIELTQEYWLRRIELEQLLAGRTPPGRMLEFRDRPEGGGREGIGGEIESADRIGASPSAGQNLGGDE